MMTTENNNQRYMLAIGYGDDYWDLGEDHYWSDSLEELFEEICTDLSFNEFVEMMNKEGYAQDEYQMWYVTDNTQHYNFWNC
jgi:hypothetical protein